MLARPLLGADPDEKLARHFDAVRRLELAQPSLNFQPSLLTLSFSQLFDGLAKKGAFLQPLDHLCGGRVMSAEIYRPDGDIEQTTLSEGVLEHIGFAEGEQR